MKEEKFFWREREKKNQNKAILVFQSKPKNYISMRKGEREREKDCVDNMVFVYDVWKKKCLYYKASRQKKNNVAGKI